MPVSIYVREKQSKAPIPLVNVTLIGDNGRIYVDDTNLRGEAEFPSIPDGKYTVKIRTPEHRPYTAKHYLTSNSILTIKMDRAYD